MGTYDAPEKVYDIVKAAPEPFCGMMKRIIEMRIAVPELPMEEVFAACLKEDDMELDEAQFALFMNTMYASDAYIRDYFRKAALDELLKKKIPVQLVGEGWENTRHRMRDTGRSRSRSPLIFPLKRLQENRSCLMFRRSLTGASMTGQSQGWRTVPWC